MTGQLRPRSRPMTVQSLLSAARLGVEWQVAGNESTLVSGISLDSRIVEPGDLYAALPGHRTHGAHFTAQALSNGAVAVLTDEAGAEIIRANGVECDAVVIVLSPRTCLGNLAALAFGDAQSRLLTLGVTGTNGKTTVAAMLAAGLRSAGRTPGVIGTVGVQVGSQAFAASRTTPEATDLHATLGYMAEHDVDAVAMEVSSIAVVEHRVDGLVLDVVGYTNLTQDHLDYHGTMEEYFGAKALLFTPRHARHGVVGVDDEWGVRLAQEASIPVTTWSLSHQEADWWADMSSSDVIVHGPGGWQVPLHLGLPGAFNIANALCALAMLGAAGVEPGQALEGIRLASVPGRMQVVGGENGVTGVVDYAHTPDAVERVLTAVRESYSGRVWVVIGAGGDRDRGKRPLMGALAAELADVVIVTDDNPRTEIPGDIRAEVLAGAMSVDSARRGRVEEAGDRREAITVAVKQAHPGDVIVVLGKGHEQGQEVMGVVTPFDDVAVLTEALAGKR